MGQHPWHRHLLLSALLLPALTCLLTPTAAQAGPLVRRAQERKACQEFAGKLQQASANPAMAQQVYQQGVLALVSRFGENPCTDIPAPGGAAAVAPGNAAAGPPPGATTAPAPAAATTPAAGTPAVPPAAAAAPSAQQQQACQQFASKLQSAAASGGAAAAQQTYTMGVQKLTGMFGPNPCPAIKPPQ